MGAVRDGPHQLHPAPSRRERLFPITSNGLASGNHLLEATSHAVCEVVERDARTLWGLRSDEEKASTRVDLSTVDDPGCRHVLECYRRAGVDVAVWETTSDVGIASFQCMIDEDGGDAVRPLYTAMGSGTHPAREVEPSPRPPRAG